MNCIRTLEWGATDDELFYLIMDDEQRPYQLYRKHLSDPDAKDELIFEEPDVLFWLGMSKTLDGKYLLVESGSSETSEVWYLDLTDPSSELKCIRKREFKVLYDVNHRNGTWWIASNIGGSPNFKVLTAPVSSKSEEWTPVVNPASGKPYFDGGLDIAVESIDTFQDHVVVEGRQGGIPRVWCLTMGDEDRITVENCERLEFPEPAHTVGLGAHLEFDTGGKIVVGYTSLVTPTQSLEIDLTDTTSRTVLKERNVPGYDKKLYACDRTTVLSRDGVTEIPVSIVYRKDTMDRIQKGEKVHVHEYAYGAYGASEEAAFMATILPLLNRGYVYVLSHVRGGGEKGRQWYEEPNGGKYLCKKNTFNDFCDIAKWLIEEKKWTTPDLLSCEGRSAGGLTIGASINQSPELFKAAILGVPFVDVVATMTDASIPLTAGEWEEVSTCTVLLMSTLSMADFSLSHCKYLF